MTPEQKLKHLALLKSVDFGADPLPDPLTPEQLEEVWAQREGSDDYLQDAINEVRCSGTKTGLKCDWSRHYESDAVAAQYIDGSWVGWTYWYGGGKHGEPEAVEWMDDAYDLTCEEKQVTVTQRTFTESTTTSR